jgi:PAS domain S-box-containing protein
MEIQAMGTHMITGLMHPEDLPTYLEKTIPRYAAAKDHEQITHQYRMKHKSGAWRWLFSNETIYQRQPDGAPRQIFGIIHDITERKKTEEEHLKYEQQLQQNQKLESLGILAGGIAHDFNNLMGGIFGYIDIANENSNDSHVSSNLSKAMDTIERARALTRQLLTFAKGGSPILQTGTLSPFLRETVQFALSGSNVSCRYDIPKELLACIFDVHQIGQVIDNLIINAQQAMPSGGTIEVSARNIMLEEKAHPKLPKGNYVKVAVKDGGIGIPEEIISKIFDPFFTTKSKGHGLGLATCYSIMKKHGGCIDVESEPGRGSTFTVYLPASPEASTT